MSIYLNVLSVIESLAFDTHELSKTVGGVALLALIVIVVVHSATNKRGK